MQIARIVLDMIFILILQLKSTSADERCEDIRCSNIFDQVCGLARIRGGSMIVSIYQNICYMSKIQCRLKSILDITQIPDEACHIRREQHYSPSGRRLTDFSVVGAHQACNHTCPTYCVDSYEPACAQIWKRGMKGYNYRPMINHCHIDLLSCSIGVNVTIQPLGKCYHNPSGLLFMSQVAAMKSLRLLEDTPTDLNYNTKVRDPPSASHRRSNDAMEWQIQKLISKLIK